MPFTPEEIESKEFLVVLRGYDKEEVGSFLRAVASGHPGITTWHAPSAATAFDPLGLMVRQHPAGATLPSEDIRLLCRRLVDTVVHCARDGGRFGITEVWFNLAEE